MARKKQPRTIEIDSKFLENLEKFTIQARGNKTKICKALNVSRETFYQWITPDSEHFKSDVSDTYKKGCQIAQEEWIALLEDETKKQITGYWVEDITESGKKTRRWIAGNANVLIHEKKNADPERWNETRRLNIEGEITTKIGTMTSEEIDKQISEIDKLLK